MSLPIEIQNLLHGKSIDDLGLKVMYKNWRGEEAVRTIIPMEIYFGATEYHPKDQWLLKVWDCEKSDYRTYAFKDIKQIFE